MLANTLLSTRQPTSDNWFPKVDKSLIVRDSPYNGITNVAARTASNKERELETFMKIQQKNEPYDNYRSIEGVAYTPMMVAYFSKENMRIIQNAIVAEVFKLTGHRIPYVNSNKLGEVMTEQFKAMMPYDPAYAREDIVKLNNLVVPRFVNVAQQSIDFHLQSQERISTLPVNLFRPTLTK